MGSMEGYEKGQMPFLDHIRRLNARHNAAVAARAAATPLWRWVLAHLGITGPAYRWQERQPLDRFMGPE